MTEYVKIDQTNLSDSGFLERDSDLDLLRVLPSKKLSKSKEQSVLTYRIDINEV